MKSGLTAGVIAGLITGILSGILVVMGTLMGLYGVLVPMRSPIIFFTGWAMITLIFCILFGLVYEKIYDSIPGKSIKKGFFFGLSIWFIKDIVAGTFLIYSGSMVTGLLEWVAAGINLIVIGIYMWTIYGLILGYLYNPKK